MKAVTVRNQQKYRKQFIDLLCMSSILTKVTQNLQFQLWIHQKICVSFLLFQYLLFIGPSLTAKITVVIFVKKYIFSTVAAIHVKMFGKHTE